MVSSGMLTITHRSRRGFTLIEALVALLMFTVIMASLSLAFSTLTKTHNRSTARQDDNASVRVIFDALRRDIQAAYASTYDPMSVFIGNSAGSGGGSSQSSTGSSTTTVGSPGLLTFTTNSYRIQADELNQGGGAQGTSAIGGNAGATDSSNVTPQAGFQIVRYDLESASGNLLRSVFTAPNLTLVQAPSPGDPGSVLASGITNIQFQFWDPNQNTWRDSWDYEQSNLTTSQANSSSATGGATGGTSAGTSAGTSSSTSTASTSYTTLTGTTIGATTGDVTFPTAVQVTIEKLDSNGQRVTYTTIIPVAAGIPYMDVSMLKNATTSSSSSSSGSKTGN